MPYQYQQTFRYKLKSSAPWKALCRVAQAVLNFCWSLIMFIQARHLLPQLPGYNTEKSDGFSRTGYAFPPENAADQTFATDLARRIPNDELRKLQETMSASPSISDYTTDLIKIMPEDARLAILDYALNNAHVAAIARYLGFLPRIVKVELMFNIPKMNLPMGSMKWHRDAMSYKYVNIFMCVTNLHERNGKYSVIGKDTIPEFGNIPNDLIDNEKIPWDRYRIEDDQMFAFVERSAAKILTGTPGTMALVDAAACYHKGGHCIDEHRVMLQISYATELEPFRFSLLEKLNLVGHPQLPLTVNTPVKRYMTSGRYQNALLNRIFRAIFWKGYRVFAYDLTKTFKQAKALQPQSDARPSSARPVPSSLTKPVNILGISAFYHDSAASLVVDGVIKAAAQEERFTRKKHDAGFPTEAVRYCLNEGGLKLSDIDVIAFYENPSLKFDRLFKTYLSYAPRGVRSFITAMPIWLKDKLLLNKRLRQEFSAVTGARVTNLPKVVLSEHHRSHAASAFFPSPFQKAAVLCLDGVGEWATTTAWVGDGNKLDLKWEIDFPHSLGLLYSAFTSYIGFKVNSGEYKLMGLAPYGEPVYVDLIRKHLVDVKADGTFRLDMRYFDFATGRRMTSELLHTLFGGPPRKPETKITQKEMDIARSIQVVTEEIVMKLATTLHREFKTDYLCLAGGVALNCVANGRLLREGPFKDIWIQPAAGDAGGALGAALHAWYQVQNKPRMADGHRDQMEGSYLGSRYTNGQIKTYLDSVGAVYEELSDVTLMPRLASILNQENVVGWFSGRMEFGPRALGGRSIIGDPRSARMQSVMNLKIKFRESFRPFAPAIKEESVSDWFDIQQKSPYMLLVAPVKTGRRKAMTDDQQKLFGIEKLNVPRSEIPAVTHVDYSARIQTVEKRTNPRFYALLHQFEAITKCPILINTSFNVRGEPIVCSPEDAYRCFMRTGIDYLVLENILLAKTAQPVRESDRSWEQEFALD